MRKLILATMAAVALFGSVALADLTVKDGAGTTRTIKNFVCETTKLCNATVLITSAGVEIGTTGSPLNVALPAATVTTLTPPAAITGFATQTTLASILSALGSPLQAGGNIANISGTVSLPTGAATAANQSTLNGYVDGIETLIGSTNTKLDTLNTNVAGPIPAGTALIGDVNVRQGGTALSASNLMPTYQGAAAAGGATQHFAVGAASTNSTNIKASAGTVYAIQTGSIAASAPYYLKLYDKATAPTCGTDTPVGVFIIPPTNSGNNVSVVVGKAFTLGIGYCVVTGIANNDNTAVPAATVLVNIDYK